MNTSRSNTLAHSLAHMTGQRPHNFDSTRLPASSITSTTAYTAANATATTGQRPASLRQDPGQRPVLLRAAACVGQRQTQKRMCPVRQSAQARQCLPCTCNDRPYDFLHHEPINDVGNSSFGLTGVGQRRTFNHPRQTNAIPSLALESWPHPTRWAKL